MLLLLALFNSAFRSNLQQNTLEGSIPDAWAAAGNLHVLKLDQNRLNGSLPARAVPSSMQQLSLAGNALEGGVPDALASSAPSLR